MAYSFPIPGIVGLAVALNTWLLFTQTHWRLDELDIKSITNPGDFIIALIVSIPLATAATVFWYFLFCLLSASTESSTTNPMDGEFQEQRQENIQTNGSADDKGHDCRSTLKHIGVFASFPIAFTVGSIGFHVWVSKSLGLAFLSGCGASFGLVFLSLWIMTRKEMQYSVEGGVAFSRMIEDLKSVYVSDKYAD
jgi:hypothetical protein